MVLMTSMEHVRTGPRVLQVYTNYFAWKTNVINADILCDELPPEVPTHEEYTLASDDGTVVINSVIYPTISHSPTVFTKNSSYNNTLIARNYNSNLT